MACFAVSLVAAFTNRAQQGASLAVLHSNMRNAALIHAVVQHELKARQ